MAEWLKLGFKGDINASVRRTEAESTLVQRGDEPRGDGAKSSSNPTPDPLATRPMTPSSSTRSTRSAPAWMRDSRPRTRASPKPSASLEPSVVLDEHSNYLNHLNQLRRINAGDDLADRPGYGLYLVRIPVTLSPGPRSRRGKGAIITVSARPVMSKHTLRTALRNVVINETVSNLTQAICHQRDGGPRPARRRRARAAILAGLVRRHRALLRAGRHRAAPRGDRAPARRGSRG